MRPSQEARALRPLPGLIFAIRWLQLPFTYLLSAMAIAASDRIMPAAAEKYGEHV